ncbi:MAG: hypothetical protein Q8M19_15635 [Reyranella sp.]|nr:hypothetical protein [Reyranella sp.]
MRATPAFGGELQARGPIAHQAQQLEAHPVAGRDRRPPAAGEGLQDQQFVR